MENATLDGEFENQSGATGPKLQTPNRQPQTFSLHPVFHCRRQGALSPLSTSSKPPCDKIRTLPRVRVNPTKSSHFSMMSISTCLSNSAENQRFASPRPSDLALNSSLILQSSRTQSNKNLVSASPGAPRPSGIACTRSNQSGQVRSIRADPSRHKQAKVRLCNAK
jgi:hypothetical protein